MAKGNKFTGGGNHKMNTAMRQVQAMQEEMARVQQEIEEKVIETSAGGGKVKVEMRGTKEITKITIAPEIVDPEDTEMLEDGGFKKIEGTETLYPADNVMISISQGPANRLMNSTEGLKANDRGLIATDEVGRTSVPGLFASGDVVKGARTVVEAVKYSKIVAEAMDEYMQSLPKDEE